MQKGKKQSEILTDAELPIAGLNLLFFFGGVTTRYMGFCGFDPGIFVESRLVGTFFVGLEATPVLDLLSFVVLVMVVDQFIIINDEFN